MPKRKAAQADGAGDAPPRRRSTRQRTEAAKEGVGAVPPSMPRTKAKAKAKAKAPGRSAAAAEEEEGASARKTAKKPAARQTKADTNGVGDEAPRDTPAKAGTAEAAAGAKDAPEAGGRQYWLMKAEPETRYERGKDISFSIDDLAARTEPEPWDGIRNYVARNNLRAMKKGDLAFFSHSNCKEPGIVGTMEIVQEHSPDVSAHDPEAPYYDPKSSPSDPRWSVVHVEFRTKFPEPIKLKEMRELGKAGGPLENMQMLKQSRLSVSRVSEEEWKFLVALAEEKGRATG